MSQQPKWKYVGNLGDVNPFDHGGLFVFVDETGVYAPEMEKLEIENDEEQDEDRLLYTVYRVCLDPCTYCDGVLSDNKYHPEHPAWWAGTEEQRKERPQDNTYLKNISDFIGCTEEKLIEMFCSNNSLHRAGAYQAVFDYHGWENGDSYPLTKLTRKEVEERYKDCKPT